MESVGDRRMESVTPAGVAAVKIRWTVQRERTWEETSMIWLALLLAGLYAGLAMANGAQGHAANAAISAALAAAWAGNAYLGWTSWPRKELSLPPLDLAGARKFRDEVQWAVEQLEKLEKGGEHAAGD